MQTIIEARPVVLAATLPPPPSVNKLWHPFVNTSGRPDLYKDEAARDYEDEITEILAYAYSDPWYVYTEPLLLRRLRESRRFRMECVFWFFYKRASRDIDNGVKCLQDAVYRWLGADDRTVIEAHQYKRIDKKRPRVVVVIREAPLPDSERDAATLDQYLAGWREEEEEEESYATAIGSEFRARHGQAVRRAMLYCDQPTDKVPLHL